MTTPGIRRAPAPCITCGQPSIAGKERCAAHQREHNQQHAANRAYYHTPAWAALRLACLVRDYNQCVICSGTHYLTAHHIHARKDGGADALNNLVTLCHACHGKVERREPNATAQLTAHITSSPAHKNR